MQNARFVGIDIGTTSVKAAVVDETGQVVSRFSQSYVTQRRTGGMVEQDPLDWLRLVHQSLAEMDLEGVVAVGLTSQVNTHVFVAEDGEALLPAIVWQDGRAQSIATELNTHASTEDKLEWWGAPMPIDASHACSRMAWAAMN